MSRDPKRNRSTYQFVIPAELHQRLEALRERWAELPSPAPVLRDTLEQFVESWEEVLTIRDRGGTDADLQRALASVLGARIMKAVTTVNRGEAKTGE